MFDIRQSPEFANFMQKIGWKTHEEEGLRFYVKDLPLLGKFVKIPRPLKNLETAFVNKLAHKYHPFTIVLDYSPTKTLILDLTQTLVQIQKQMDKDTRYEIQKAQKENVMVEESNDIQAFVKMWHDNARRRGFWIPFKKQMQHLYESFGGKESLLFATSQGQKISGALILFFGKTAYYYHAASSPKGRKLSSQHLLIWEAIKLAKKKGYKLFDFEGILDERNKDTKRWRGFTHFKKGFGGKEVEYPLTKVTYYHPLFKFLNLFQRRL